MKSFKIAINRFKYVLLCHILLSTFFALCFLNYDPFIANKEQQFQQSNDWQIEPDPSVEMSLQNLFSPQAQLAFYDSIITTTHNKVEYPGQPAIIEPMWCLIWDEKKKP